MSDENPTRVRASDEEREQVAEVLRQAMGEGRLTLAEGEERLAETYATTYRDELPRLTADLPRPEPARPSGGRPRARRSWRRRPAIVLAVAAAVAAGVWAAVASGPLWPAILLGILAIILVKRAWLGHSWHGHAHHGHATPGHGEHGHAGSGHEEHRHPWRCGRAYQS